jgi:hypothetical protein
MARMGGREVHSEFKKGNLKETADLDDLEEDKNLILKIKT